MSGLMHSIPSKNETKKTANAVVKEQSIQDYLTNSSGILRQINVKT